MVFTAIALVAMLAIATLVIDLGFDEGQRRFMQNGADAAALAAANFLANNVSPLPAGSAFAQFFGVTDAQVYQQAYNTAYSNQNPGITGRTTSFAVKLEYCVAANSSSYSIAPGCPSPNSWVTSTDNPAGDSVPHGTYKVRVTVTSTISTLFGRVIGVNSTTTLGQAIAVIQGVCPQTTATGNIWPFTLWNQQNFGTDYNTLYELWGSTAPSPPFAGNWQNVLDLTPAARWCDGNTSTTDADYSYLNRPGGTLSPQAFPSTDGAQGSVTCNNGGTPFAGQDTTWYRDGFAEDPSYPGYDTNVPDLGIWAACTFQGTLRVRQGATPGNKIPTYVDANPAQTGNGGNNVAQGIYGPGTYTCPNGTTYFFQGDTQIDPAHPSWGPYRDIVVFTYDNPEYWHKSQNAWTTNGNSPDRVELMRILPFRIYENYSTAGSRIYGKVVSPAVPPGSNPPTCGFGPDIYGNVASLGS